MRKALLGICLAATMMSVSVWAEDLAFDIPKLDGIAIDGDAADWGNRGFYVGLLADETRSFKEASDFDGRLWLGWDDQGLLVRAEGRDDQHVEHPEDWAIWAMDAVELFMAIEPGSQERYQIVVAPGHTKEQPKLRIQYYEFRQNDELRKIQLTGDAAATRVADRYVLEVRMPWSNLALMPHPGMTCGFQIYLNDFDPDDPAYLGRYTAMWYPGGQSNWYPDRMYKVRLADAPSAPVLAMGAARAFTEQSLLWVEINAVDSLAGHTLAVSGSGLKDTTVKLEPFQGRAVARTYMATDTAKYDPTKVRLAIDGAPVDNVARDAVGLPSVDFDIAPEGEDYVITPRLEPRGAFPIDKPAKVALYDEQGRQRDAFSVRPGQSARVHLDKGMYLFTGRYPGRFGKPIEGGRGFAVGFSDDQHERLAAFRGIVAKVRDRANEAVRQTYEGYWLYSLDLLRICMEERPNDFAKNEGSFIEWLIRPQVDPDALYQRRGEFEWAYRSKVDGTGEPFSVWLPYSYSPKTPIGGCLWLHGSGGTHHEIKEMPDTLVASVLGRARASGYGDLCGVDVMEVYDYVLRHWNVDPERVGVFGASMGGFGTYQIASEYPDLFSAASPWMGGAVGIAVENLTNVPVYALHGTHDELVPIAYTRTALQRIEECGGMTVLEALPKLGHGFTTESEAHSKEWVRSHVRTTKPNRIHYKALHNGATGAYGVNVIEWGAEWRPATFDAVRDGDTLYLTLDNIRILKVGLAGIKRVSVNQGLYLDVPGTDNGVFYVLNDGEAKVTREKPALPEPILNSPGGAHNLYHGDPILVVWGTQADADTNRRMLDVAERLRRAPTPAVPEDDTSDRHSFMMHGKLYGKADTEVTEEDLRTYSLVLIGTANQNAVVAKLAGSLPLTLTDGTLRTNDGVAWSSEGRGWALTYYNPMASTRRLLWIASETPTFYRPNMTVLTYSRYPGVAPDLIIADAEGRRMTAQRCFDTRWQWAPAATDYLKSPALPTQYCSVGGFGDLIGNGIINQTGADATLLSICVPPDKRTREDTCVSWTPGVTRLADVELSVYWEPLTQFTFSAEEMTDLQKLTQEMEPDWGHTTAFLSHKDTFTGTQRVVTRDWTVGNVLSHQFDWNNRAERSPFELRDVLKRGLDRLKP